MPLFKDLNVIYYYVKDWEGAKKFYTKVLEWPVAWASEEMGWLEFGREGETHLAINRWDRDDPLPTKGAVATFTVEDAENKMTQSPNLLGSHGLVPEIRRGWFFAVFF